MKKLMNRWSLLAVVLAGLASGTYAFFGHEKKADAWLCLQWGCNHNGVCAPYSTGGSMGCGIFENHTTCPSDCK